MALTARDLMQADPIALGPDTPLIDAHRTFVEEQITGAPVVDEMGKLLGVVSSTDLLRTVREEHDSPRGAPVYFDESFDFAGPRGAMASEDFQDALANRTVDEVMTPSVVSVGPNASVGEVARALRENHIHRVLVVEGSELIGIISTFDLTALLEEDGAKSLSA